jgi:hypothetical protein
MVRLQSLDLPIGVRIPASQPNSTPRKRRSAQVAGNQFQSKLFGSGARQNL